MRKILLYLLCFFISLFFGSCSDEKEPDSGKLTVSSSDRRFTVDETGTVGLLSFGPAAAQASVQVNSEIAWTHSFRENTDWCTADRTGDELTFTVTTFNEPERERSVIADILFQGESRAVVKITQKGDDSQLLKLSSTDALIHGTGGFTEVTVSGIAEEWDYEPSDGNSWVKHSREGSTLRFEAEANTGDGFRQAEFTIFTGPENNREKEVLKVAQPTDKEMVLEYTLTSEILEVYLPFIGELALSVDWGDGTPVETIIGEYMAYDEEDADHDFIIHAYDTPGIYTVRITGAAEAMYCGHIQRVNLLTLTDLKRWGNLGLKMMYNAITWSSLKKLPASTDGGFSEVVTFYRAFHSNSSLEYIEEGLFNDAHKSKSFEYTFVYCYGLKEVGPNMFRGLQAEASFECAFFFCTSLEKIGEGFAQGCKATSFKHAFFQCPALKDIPAGMFAGADNCRTFESVFQSAHGLTYVPDRLFENCTAAVDFGTAFYNCINITELGHDLFKGCSKIDRMNSLFAFCAALEEVPENLFDGVNRDVTYVNHAFSGSGLKTIPEKLLYPLKNVNNLASLFANTKVTEIPENLFYENVALSDIADCFANTAITRIPENLFENGWKITNMTGVFRGTLIESVPAGLFRECFQIATIFELFSDCTRLSDVPVSVFDNCKRIEVMDYAFYNCTSLTGASPFTIYNGENVPLYRRYRFTSEFTAPTSNLGVFFGCAGLSDYPLLESDFPEWLEDKPTFES